jgi:hypothetical protein
VTIYLPIIRSEKFNLNHEIAYGIKNPIPNLECMHLDLSLMLTWFSVKSFITFFQPKLL